MSPDRRTFLKSMAAFGGALVTSSTEQIANALEACGNQPSQETKYYAQIGVYGELFRPVCGCGDRLCRQEGDEHVAPAPNRQVDLLIYTDPRAIEVAGRFSIDRDGNVNHLMNPSLIRSLLICDNGNGWGVNPETGQPYYIDSHTGRSTFLYEQQGAGSIRENVRNLDGELCESPVAYVSWLRKQGADRARVAIGKDGNAQVEHGIVALCPQDLIPGNIAYREFNTNINLYGAKDWIQAKPGQLLPPPVVNCK